MVLVVIAGVVVLTTEETSLSRVEHPATPLPAPAGVEPQQIAPEGLGISLLVPSTWIDRTGVGPFDRSYGASDGSVYVGAWRLVTIGAPDVEAFADDRHAWLSDAGAAYESTNATAISEHDAVVSHLSLPSSQANPDHLVVTEYGIDLRDGTWAVIVVGETAPEDQRYMRDWIGSTLSIIGAPPVGGPLDHPAALSPPGGVQPKTIAPDELRVSFDVPASWNELHPAPSGFDFGIRAERGPTGFVVASRMPVSNGSPAQRRTFLRSRGADIVDSTETTIDGRPVAILRYTLVDPGRKVFGVFDTEYVIDIGDGDVAIVVIGSSGGASTELLEWIRSSIHFTG